MALLREPNSTALAQFAVPVKGTWQSLAVHALPLDAVYDSNNVFIREGKLRNRPALTLLNGTVFNSAIIGGSIAVTPVEKRILAVTKDALYELGEFDPVWTLRTTLPFGTDDNSVVDMCFLESANAYTAIIANEKFTLRKWTIAGGAATFGATLGLIPQAKSVCVASRRIVALVPPHTLVWSSTYTFDSWPTLAYAKVAQTNDVGICVRTLSSLAFVLYKERSIYYARAQAGDDSTAFSLAEPIIVEGPAGVHAVVNVNGTHVYMTKNGRIASFNGTNYPTWIADGIWLYLQSNIDPLYAHKIFGVYDYRLHCVVFVYPKVGTGGTLTGIVIINLPFEGTDIQAASGLLQPASFLGELMQQCSYGCELRFNRNIDRSVLFTVATGNNRSVIFDEQGEFDVGVEYQCHFQTGLQGMPNAEHTQCTVETFVERGVGYGGMFVVPVTSDGLENKGGTIHNSIQQLVDLETNPVVKYQGFNVPTRFFGLRYSWSSRDNVRYSGSVVYGRGMLSSAQQQR